MSDFIGAIDRLAKLVPDGQLAAIAGPDMFLDHVTKYIEELQGKLETAEKERDALRAKLADVASTIEAYGWGKVVSDLRTLLAK